MPFHSRVNPRHRGLEIRDLHLQAENDLCIRGGNHATYPSAVKGYLPSNADYLQGTRTAIASALAEYRSVPRRLSSGLLSAIVWSFQTIVQPFHLYRDGTRILVFRITELSRSFDRTIFRTICLSFGYLPQSGVVRLDELRQYADNQAWNCPQSTRARIERDF